MHDYDNSLPKPVKVREIIQENYKTKTFVLDVDFDSKPGQFVMIWVADKAEKPFSITSTNPLNITVMDVGKFSHYLNTEIKKGDTLWYRGPFGNGYFKVREGLKVIVGGGCGVVPLYHLGLVLKKKEEVENTMVILGAKTKQELLFVKKFRSLGFKVIVTTNDGSSGQKGFTTDVLREISENQDIACVYSCGPELMLKNVAKVCGKHEIKFQLSMEALVKCGFGVCGSCARGGKLICKDGPVFDKYVE